VRGDGNCFYTAIGFRLFEYYLETKQTPKFYEQIDNTDFFQLIFFHGADS
jgi:Peptidase C65 Otubain